jgi:hypothetical protein
LDAEQCNEQNIFRSDEVIRKYALPVVSVICLVLALTIGRELIRVIRIQTWPSVEGSVDSSAMSGDGIAPDLWTPEITYLYQVDGDTYRVNRMGTNRYHALNTGDDFHSGDRFALPLGRGPVMPEKWPKTVADEYVARWPCGATVTVYYDPGHPARSVIERGHTPTWMLALLLLVWLGLVAVPVLLGLRFFRGDGDGRLTDRVKEAFEGVTTRSGAIRASLQTSMLVSVAVFAFLPADFETTGFFPYGAEGANRGRQGYEVVEIILLRPWLVWTIYMTMAVTVLTALIYCYRFYRPRPVLTLVPVGVFAGWLLMRIGLDVKYYLPAILATGWVLALRPGPRLLTYGVLAIILGTAPIACGSRMANNLAPWNTFDELMIGGSVYRFMDSSFMQGQTMALTVDETSNLIFSRRKVIGTTNGDSPRSYLRIVRRAADSHEGYGQLYLSPDNLLVGVRAENLAYFAYDITHDSFYGHGLVEEMSPFILIDDKAALNDSDVRSILGAMGDTGIPPGYDMGMGIPKDTVIEEATRHPNPEVRVAAQKMLSLRASVAPFRP